MSRYIAFSIAAVIAVGNLSTPWCSAQAKGNESQEQAARAQQAAAQEQAMRAQQAAARQAQEQAMRAQQAAARQMQEQQFKMQQEEARKIQEQEIKAQQQAHLVQEQALKAQEEQARRMQEQAIKAQQDAARAAQAQAIKLQQDAARAAQEQAIKSQQGAARMAQEQAARAQAAQEEASHRAQQTFEHEQFAPTINKVGTAAFMRPFVPRPFKEEAMPLKKAVSMPVVDPNATAEQQAHAQEMARNLESHLIAVPSSQVPPNISAIRNFSLNNYTNNYQAYVGGQPIYINRENTLIYPVPYGSYPYWYQPEPGWIYSNGFELGSVCRVGLDWLRWNWHPCYGPPPEGFICARDYVPTPWVYVPGYGLWMQPGICGYASSGPPYDYTGPITVELIEPRHVHVRDPFNGWEQTRTIDVLYLYNAYFYPEYERWGYMNHHGNFIWLNI
jgi:hypothetical protein